MSPNKWTSARRGLKSVEKRAACKTKVARFFFVVFLFQDNIPQTVLIKLRWLNILFNSNIKLLQPAT